jgi:hypothetical protein
MVDIRPLPDHGHNRQFPHPSDFVITPRNAAGADNFQICRHPGLTCFLIGQAPNRSRQFTTPGLLAAVRAKLHWRPVEMDKPANPVNDTERLDSWKEIASYLKRGVRTVQRWETSGLPVHRLELEKRGAVHAYKSEIDLWWQQRSATITLEGLVPPSVNRTVAMRRRLVAIALAVPIVLAALFLAIGRNGNPQLSNARRLTWEGGVLTPALSPDGKWIAFSSPRLSPDQNLDLWLRPAGGGDLKRLTQTAEHEFDPVFAPDSSRILYSVSDRRPAGMMELEGPHRR